MCEKKDEEVLSGKSREDKNEVMSSCIIAPIVNIFNIIMVVAKDGLSSKTSKICGFMKVNRKSITHNIIYCLNERVVMMTELYVCMHLYVCIIYVLPTTLVGYVGI